MSFSTSEDWWGELRRYTEARIAIGRSGHALPTAFLLDFQLAHAKARDAIHVLWDIEDAQEKLQQQGWKTRILHSAVSDRYEYLRRPDKGRRLAQRDYDSLLAAHRDAKEIDVGLILCDGLSSMSIENHAPGFLAALKTQLTTHGLSFSPLYLVHNGRVALADQIGEAIRAKIAVIIIGERPGLSAPDSLGVYMTYRPKTGNSDAMRNCISNIRPPHGLGYELAAQKLAYLLTESLRRQISGVELKDNMPGNFLDGQQTRQID